MIDSHAHLDSDRYTGDLDALLARAHSAGVRAILSIGIGDGPATMHRALDLAREYSAQPGIPEIYATAGIHPHEARLADPASPDPAISHTPYADLDHLLAQPEILACGEIGLDYYYDHSPRAIQQSVFLRQMEIAAAHQKPIVIHCRPSDNSTNAWDDTLALLEDHWRPTNLGGILHCFTGELAHARRALDLGFLISFAGNITYPKAQNIRAAAAEIPLDRILIETDAPFLAPVPLRGQRNEPAFVAHTAARLAELRRIQPEEAALRTAENFRHFFRLPADNVPSSRRNSG
jgi:TatD DNase family protein